MSKQYPWFRMYVDFLNDPKLIALAFEDQRHFIGLLALKSDGALDSGCAPELLDRIVAQRLWIDQAVIREVKKRLIAAGLISDCWQPLAWEKRQFASDSSKERVAKFRAKKKAAAGGEDGGQCGNGDGNDQGNDGGNDDETLQKRRSNAVDTDTDTEVKEEAKASLSTAALPDCPHAEIIELFGDKLPELPQPRTELWGGQRAKALKARWRWCLTASRKDGRRYATNRDEALLWFGKFFAYIRRCPHLMGDNTRGWTPDLGWLVKEENFTKVQQGNYEVKTGEGA